MFGCGAPRAVQVQTNGASKDPVPLLAHFDVNKTIIQSDSIQMKSIDQGIREGVSELFWGHFRKDGEKVEWEWTRGKPSCAPPSDDVCLVGAKLVNYAQYCKEMIKDKAQMKEAIRTFSLVADKPVKEEMERLRQLTIKRMQLEPEVRGSSQAEAAGIKGPTFNMFPTLFHLAATLQRMRRPFGLIFRSFGADHEKIQTEWNAFCEMRHPLFSRLIDDIGPMNGTVASVPDRRIHNIHTIYRDQQGPVLILDTFTNGPEDASWDNWAKSKPKPKADTRNGREYIRRVLKAKTVEGYAAIQKWMRQHTQMQATTAIKDDWAWWQYNGEQAVAGKLLVMLGGRKPIQQLFFDDNIEFEDARIVDCREVNGVCIPHAKSLKKLCVKVNPVEAMLDNDYFLRKVLASQGDHLDAGSSLLGLQKQLTEVEEEKSSLQKQLGTMNLQLKTLTEENRRMKLQRRINIRDEGELQSLLAKDVELSTFGQGGYRSVSDLYYELEQGVCWLEVNEQGRLARVLDMLYLKILFKDHLLIESHEQHSSGRGNNRNYFPGVQVSLKETSIQQALDRWFESGLQVNLKKCIETELLPVSAPDAPVQATLATQAYPIPCVVHQSIGTFVIAEKEVDIHKEVLAKIGLPGAKHFTTTENDLSGSAVTRLWRWDKQATWEAQANGASKATSINVAATCDKIFAGNARKEVYTRIILEMFERFEAQLLTGGFSGSVVIRVQPIEASGRPEAPCIVKLDAAEAIRGEYVNSVNVFEALPDRAAQILGQPVYATDAAGEEFAAMRLELAGACWNVPELAQGSTNLLSTFKDLLLYESEQMLLQNSNVEAGTRPFGNVNSVLAETFGPGGVVSALRKGSKGLHRAEGKPLLWGWYTLKGKESDYNPLTAKKGEYPPSNAIRRLYKDHFGGDLPALKDLVVGQIKPDLEKLSAKAGKELCPLIGLAHGDLNAANIMIDALDAVWMIDFATSVDLPLFTDMCKFEMACLFEYATIPITPKLLVEFASTQESAWKSLNVGDWLRVDENVAISLLQKLVALPPERLASISQGDLERLIEEVVSKSGKKPSSQRKMSRAMKARLVVDESMTEAALTYCNNISNALLSGDYIGETLEIKNIPLPEGRGSRGASSLRFFMEICVSIRRFMSQDVLGVLREQNKAPGGIQPCDVLSLQMWLPFLRESYRIIGYRDVAPQCKLWSIYHCSKVAKNVSRMLDNIKKNMNKLQSLPVMADFKADVAKKGSLQREKTGDLQNFFDGGGMEADSHWIFHHGTRFPLSELQTCLVRKMHSRCEACSKGPGFYAPVWQVLNSEEAPMPLSFEGSVSGKGGALDLQVEVPSTEPGAPPTRIRLGMVLPPGGRKEQQCIVLSSRLFRLTSQLMSTAPVKNDEPDYLESTFSLNSWSGGVFSETGELVGRRKSAARMQLQQEKQLAKYLSLEAKAYDASGRERQKFQLILGMPVYCYPPGARICVDVSGDADQGTSPVLVVTGLADTGLYTTRSAERPVPETENEFDPTPTNHTYRNDTNYSVGTRLIIKESADAQGWSDAQVTGPASEDSGFKYTLLLQSTGQTVSRSLDCMNSGRATQGLSAEVFEEEMNKIKIFFRARYSSVIDSLSGVRLDIKECAPPTLSFASLQQMDRRMTRQASKGWGTSGSLGSSSSPDGAEARSGWQMLLSAVELCERMLPTCHPNAFLILGEPGSGKSCLVCRLIMETLDRYAHLVPLVLPISDMVKRSGQEPELLSLNNSVIYDWFDKYLRITWGEDSLRYWMVVQAIKMKRVLFLFEGLEDGKRLTPVIEACIRNLILDRHLVVVTSRPVLAGQTMLEEMGELLTVMRLGNLLDEHKRQIAHARLGLEGIDAFDRLFRKLQDSQSKGTGQEHQDEEFGEGKEDVFGNPMMLSMLLCYLQTMQKNVAEGKNAEGGPAEEDDKGEATITVVYRVALDVMLQRVQSSNQAERLQKEKRLIECRRILEKMAIVMQMRRSHAIGVNEVEPLLAEDLKPMWANLKAAVVAGSAMFLRMTEEANKSEFHFLVKGFQNYFAANAVAHDGFDGLPDLVALLTEPWWSQMLEMLAEAFAQRYVELIEQRLERFKPQDGESFLHIAARAGHRPVFQFLHLFSESNRVALSTRNRDMRTPLHIAAEKGNTTLCAYMLEHSAPIDAEDSNERLAMHVAMQYGAFQTAKFLLNRANEERMHERTTRRGSVNGFTQRPNRGQGQVENLAQRIMNGMSEEDFRKEAFQTFPELQYFSSKERDWKDRTVGGILAVFWIAANQYDQFVRSQPQEKRLTKGSWETLQTWARRTVGLVKSPSILGAMLVFVAISNLGKIKPFCDAFAPEFDEHTEALTSILQKHPNLVPSFAKLEFSLQQTILTSLKADFNFGQFLQAENLPASLYTVKQKLLEGEGGGPSVGSSVNILSFFLFKLFSQMCGIFGPKSLEGSLFMQEFNYSNFKTGIDMLQHLERETAQEVYDRFLGERAKQQNLTVSSYNPEGRAIVRLACLSRIFDAKNGAEVAEAFNSLDSDTRRRLTNLLNSDGIIEKPGFLLYGSPNLMQNSRDNAHIGASLGMQVMLRVYEAAAKEYAGSEQQVVTIMVDELAVRAKSCTDPECFAFTPFDITRTAGYKADTQGTARISPWQLVNDPQMIEGTKEEIDSFATDIVHGGLRESVFLKRLPLKFPELKFMTDNEEAKNILAQTKCGFLVMFWIVNHQREAFTRGQESGKKLSEKSWNQITSLVETVYSHHEVTCAVLVVMLLHALGKLQKFQAQLAPRAESPTEVLEHVLDTCPKVLPSYSCLSDDCQRLARVCLTRHFDFRQFLFGESVPANAKTVKDMMKHQEDGNNEWYMSTYLFCIFAQLAASLGPQSLDGSIYMTEEKWHECEVGLEAIRHLETESEPQIYDRFYKSRSDLVGHKFNSAKPETRALARLACICSITTPEGGDTLLEAFESLQPDERSALTTHLCADGINQKPGFLLSKCQEFMANAMANQEVGLRPALLILLKVHRAVAREFSNCSRPVLKIQLEKLASFAGSFTGSLTFQDLPFELEHTSDHEALVIPKLWIPINKDNKAVLDALSLQGKELAADVLKGQLSEKQFKGRLGRVFPELSYFDANAEDKRQQTYGAMLSILWLVSNQHEHFIRSQPEDEQLSKQSWAWIQDWMTEGVKAQSEDALDAMLTFMAIHALGKIKEFCEELAPGYTPQMHDVALAHILQKQPEVVPSFLRLAPHYQRLIVDSLSVDFEFSQFLQAENVPANLMVVKDKLEPHGEDGFAFFCFRIFVQMCGKLGAKSLSGSLFMTEPQFLRFRPGLDALQQLRTLEAGSAYNTFLLLQGSKALSRFASPEHHAIARLLCLGSACDHARGDALCRAFDDLDPAERARLTRWLTADGINQRPGYVLCDAPNYLQNAEANPLVGLPAALSMLVSVQQMCTEGWGVNKVYLHLDELSAWAKEAGADADEFMAAEMQVNYQDVGDARIFRVQVIRPQFGPTSARTTPSPFLVVGMVLFFLMFVGSLAGTLGLAFFPDVARPALRDATKPYHRLAGVTSDLALKVFGAASAISFLLLFLLCRAADCFGCGRLRCCRICCCCGSAATSTQYRRPGSRPLLCNYTLLGPDGSPV